MGSSSLIAGLRGYGVAPSVPGDGFRKLSVEATGRLWSLAPNAPGVIDHLASQYAPRERLVLVVIDK